MRARARRLVAAISEEDRLRHMAHLRVDVGSETLVDRHFRGPRVTDLFSATKTVVATLVGIAVERGFLDGLERRVGEWPGFESTPSRDQTLRHLMTMTRGARVDGPWELDAVLTRSDNWALHIAHAPSLTPPGERFTYDNGAAHLAAALLQASVGGDLLGFADAHLFAPLGIRDWSWLVDPVGVPCGAAHLRMSPGSMARLGHLWCRSEGSLDPVVATAMRTPSSPGGPPEDRAYGFGSWIEDDDSWFAAGWGGQLILVRPRDELVVVASGDTGYTPGPPPTDSLQADWQGPLELVRTHLLTTR